jgi:hypothetical protein
VTSNGYLAEFVDKVQLGGNQEVGARPNWVDSTNSSLKAYEAIIGLEDQKKQYIRRYSTPSQFTKKSNYQIMKVEVARIVGVNPQPLFHNVGYSKPLARFLDGVNQRLDEAKCRKLARNKGGLRQKSKEVLVKELQSEKQINETLISEIVDGVYKRTLDSLPLDVKKKLRLG